MDKKIISVGILRARLRLSGYLPPCIFAFLCIYLVYTVYVLMILGNSAIMAVSNGLLYMMTQAPSYFLLYAPAMAVLLSGLIDTGSFELMIFARTDTRKEYVYGKLLAIFSFVIICMVCALMADSSIYLCVANPNAQWNTYCIYLQQQGLHLVHESMLNKSSFLVVAMQFLTLMLSFFSLGAFMLLLQNLFAKKFISVIVPLCIWSAFYLALTCDLPEWLAAILPGSHLFLPSFDSLRRWAISILYWIGILLALCSGVIVSSKCKDVIYNDYEKIYQ